MRRRLRKPESGLAILATVLLTGGSAAGPGGLSPRTHTYFVAADEVTWDYAPSGPDQIKGRPFDETERPFVEAQAHSVGKVTLKALMKGSEGDTPHGRAGRRGLDHPPGVWEDRALEGTLGPCHSFTTNRCRRTSSPPS